MMQTEEDSRLWTDLISPTVFWLRLRQKHMEKFNLHELSGEGDVSK